MIDQSNLPKKKYHLLKNLREKTKQKRMFPSLSSLVAQLFIIKKDGRKLLNDLRNGLVLVGKIVFRNKFRQEKE